MKAISSKQLQVINYANNSSRAQAMVEELNKIPSNSASKSVPRFAAIQADVCDKAAIQRLVQETVDQFGRIDVCVSNAGWTRMTNFNNFDEGVLDDDWDKCFLYNVKSHMWLAHAARNELEKSEGAFITTTSVAGVKPSGSSLPYAVTKAAAIHLTKALAVICAPKIRFNSISPGLLLTEWGLKFGPEKIAAATEATKLKRLATVEVRLLPICVAVNVPADAFAGLRGTGQGAGDRKVDDGAECGTRQWHYAMNEISLHPGSPSPTASRFDIASFSSIPLLEAR